MAFNGEYEYDPNGIDQIISEKGNWFLALREVRWSKNKDFKMDLRHYMSDEAGDQARKGCSFTYDEADDLVRVLLEEGFGDEKAIAETIMEHRPNLCGELACLEGYDDYNKTDSRETLFTRINDTEYEKDEEEEEYYNPREAIL